MSNDELPEFKIEPAERPTPPAPPVTSSTPAGVRYTTTEQPKSNAPVYTTTFSNAEKVAAYGLKRGSNRVLFMLAPFATLFVLFALFIVALIIYGMI